MGTHKSNRPVAGHCAVCGSTNTDGLDKIYYNSSRPDIDIGPYCAECLCNIRICTFCNRPKVIDVDVFYINNGTFQCLDCKGEL